jgi:predicted nucleic acid-binding protein
VLLYLDTSALVKLVFDEKETPHLRRWMADHTDDRLVSSAITRTELRRAVLRFAQRPEVDELQTRNAVLACARLLQEVDHVRVTYSILDRAGLEPPARLRSLDAIHLTTAADFRSELRALVAYDNRLLQAAHDIGVNVAAPGADMPW